MKSDAALVTAILAGQRGLFADLVRRYERVVVAEALRVLHDYHAAQDVAQDAFVTAYERLAGLRKPSGFGAWLLQIARRRALDAVRQRSAPQDLESVPPPASRNSNGQVDEVSSRLLAALGRLPEHERVVVLLCYFEGRKVSEIAEMTQRPVSTVTVQLMRARTRLHRWLKEFEL